MAPFFDTLGRRAAALNRRVQALLPGSAAAARDPADGVDAAAPSTSDERSTPVKPSDVWKAVATYPLHDRTAEQGYQHVVDVLRRFVKAPAYYLYRRTEDAYMLVFMDLVFARDAAWRERLPRAADEDTLRHPDLKMTPRAAFEEAGRLDTWLGETLCLPLRDAQDEPAGLVLCGPHTWKAADVPGPDLADAFAQAAGTFSLQAHALEHLHERLQTFEARDAVSRRMLGSVLEVDRFVKLLLQLALAATGSEAGFIAIRDEADGTFRVRAHEHLPEGFLDHLDLAPRTGLFEWDPGQGGPLVVHDFEFVADYGATSILGVPVTVDGALVGVFTLLNFGRKETFADFSLTLLMRFVEQIRLVIGNARLFYTFTAQYLATVEAMSEAYEVRSVYTEGHSRRVARLGAALARELGLSRDEVEQIHRAGLIHDVGMCGVVSLREGYQADFEHPNVGASMIEMLPIAEAIVEGVRTHHEWHNGWGFPQGLAGDQIPTSGRVLAVAEFVVESAAGNPVREPMDLDALYDALDERRGVQFDPDVVDAFLALPREEQMAARPGG